MPPTKFRVDRASGSGGEDSWSFWDKAPPRGPRVGQRPDFNNLQSTSCPNVPHQISTQSAQRFGRKSRKCKKLTHTHTDTHTDTQTTAYPYSSTGASLQQKQMVQFNSIMQNLCTFSNWKTVAEVWHTFPRHNSSWKTIIIIVCKSTVTNDWAKLRPMPFSERVSELGLTSYITALGCRPKLTWEGGIRRRKRQQEKRKKGGEAIQVHPTVTIQIGRWTCMHRPPPLNEHSRKEKTQIASASHPFLLKNFPKGCYTAIKWNTESKTTSISCYVVFLSFSQ